VTTRDEPVIDLGPFVTVRTRNEVGRRLHNPRVQALLQAGSELLTDGVQSGIEHPFRFPSMDAVCGSAAYHPPFSAGPRRYFETGLDRAFPAGGPPPGSAVRSAENAFRKTWSRLEHYRADLAMYTLTKPAWFGGDENARTALAELTARPAILDAVVERIASADLRLFEDSLFRVQLVMQAMAPSEDLIREAIDRMYATIDRTWTVVYQGFLDHYGVRLRPDVTVSDITHILTAAAEGIGLRRLVHLDDRTIYDAVRKRSLLGKTTFCVFAASIAPDGDPRTVAEFFRQTVTGDTPPG